ncbi:MAG: argininosuccinate lyase [Phycisphaeraceae bacterium]|nr:argininosuccinate lyase [Phycisphaeraceae bacterium]
MATNHPKPKPWEHAKSGGSEADPLAARFVESLSYDTRLYEADIRGSIAHARMLRSVGLLTSPELASIEQGLSELRDEIESAPAGPNAVGVPGAWPGWRIDLEDVHMCIEAALIDRIGDAGRKLHTGRSRNDQVALDLRLWLRDAAATMASLLDDCMAALAALSQNQGDIIMPAYTHLQRAQPIRLSAELLAWHEMLAADRRMFNRLEARGKEDSPLGSGAVAGSTLPLDREHAAELLEFTSASASSIEATASRDDALDFLYALARTAMHLSRWAEQWILYCTTEFSFLRLAPAHTTGSSMMPQKRNPDMLELIRGRCGTVYGSLLAMLTICKGLPIAYNRDLQEDKRHVFAAFDTVSDTLQMTARIIAGARFVATSIEPTLHRGHLDATVLAEYLVTRGMPFRTAHQVVGALVRRCDELDRPSLEQLTLDDFNAALREHDIKGVRIGDEVFSWLGARNAVSRYVSAGHGASSIGDSPRPGKPGDRRLSTPEGESGAGAPEASPSEPGPAPANPSLFPTDTPPESPDGRLIQAYAAVSRTLDDLPYTPEFDRLHASLHSFGAPTKRVVFHRLQNLRKAGKLPKVGRAASAPPVITPPEEETLRELVTAAVGSLGQRDQLPFTEQFDRLVEQFNTRSGRSLEPHSIWRLIAKLAK